MVFVMLADGFEEIEAITPIDIMRRAGIEVITVGVENKTVTGAHGITVTADTSRKKDENNLFDLDEMDLLLLPGGAGYEILDKSYYVNADLKFARNNKRYIAAICAAPSILGKRGLLEGKKATCFPGFEQYLEGAKVLSDSVVVDGNIITARGAGAASEFGFTLVELLKDKATADALRKTMQYE